jgi:hypothetical protein
VNGLGYVRAGINADLLNYGHQRLAELIEGLLRLPDFEHLELVAGSETSVMQAAGGIACTSGIETPDDLVILRGGHGCGVYVDADCHEFLPSSLTPVGSDTDIEVTARLAKVRPPFLVISVTSMCKSILFGLLVPENGRYGYDAAATGRRLASIGRPGTAAPVRSGGVALSGGLKLAQHRLEGSLVG